MSNSRIWRDSNTVPVTDIIQFNASPTLPDDTGSINQTSITLKVAIASNPKPKIKLDELQDVAFASMTFIISGFIDDPTNSLIPNQVKGWLIDAKTVTTTFPFGRFGIQLDDFPAYNVRPNTNRGCMIEDWTWIRAGETRGKAEFTATVRFNASQTGLNSPTYAWDTT